MFPDLFSGYLPTALAYSSMTMRCLACALAALLVCGAAAADPSAGRGSRSNYAALNVLSAFRVSAQ